jgi:hypothetical protein
MKSQCAGRLQQERKKGNWVKDIDERWAGGGLVVIKDEERMKDGK